jgi:nucleoside-diphosphate-sugar epimerase
MFCFITDLFAGSKQRCLDDGCQSFIRVEDSAKFYILTVARDALSQINVSSRGSEDTEIYQVADLAWELEEREGHCDRSALIV